MPTILTRRCDHFACNAVEEREITIEQPDDATTFRKVKFPPLFRNGPRLTLNLCPKHYSAAREMLRAWAQGVKSLDQFMTMQDETTEV